MKNIAAFLLLLGLLVSGVSSEPTEVSYIVEVEEEERQDFLEVTFSTNAESSSLVEAIKQAKTEAENLRDQAREICANIAKNKRQCEEAVQIGNVEIEPTYKQNKKQTHFQKITATFEVVVKWKEVKVFGTFVDHLLTVEGIIIEKIQWQPDEDLAESHFLEESLEKSSDLCAELGKKFIKVSKVEQLREQPEKPEPQPPAEKGEEEQEEEEPEEEPDEEEQKPDQYKITIICDGKLWQKKKKKK